MVLIRKRVGDKIYYLNNIHQWVKEISKAHSFKAESAENVINNSNTFKAEYENHQIEIITHPYEMEAIPLTDEEAEKAYEQLRFAVQIFGEAFKMIPSIREHYQKVQQKQEAIQQDLLHKIEFEDTIEYFYGKFGKMIHDSRIIRRDAKDKLQYLEDIDVMPAELLAAHDKYDKNLEERVYGPRALPELFD